MGDPDTLVIDHVFLNVEKRDEDKLNSLGKLEDAVREMICSFILTSAKRELFDQDPSLKSFGWDQFISAGDGYSKKMSVYSTRCSPVIDESPNSVQTAQKITVGNFLTNFKMELLMLAFGENATVTIFRDLTFRVTHDN